MSQKRDLVLAGAMEREFDAKETMQWLTANKLWVMTWGARNFLTYQNRALFFSVSGRKHNGIVLITLAWNDTYTVRLLSTQWNEKQVFTEVYCDCLAELIDEKVERIAEYKR